MGDSLQKTLYSFLKEYDVLLGCKNSFKCNSTMKNKSIEQFDVTLDPQSISFHNDRAGLVESENITKEEYDLHSANLKNENDDSMTPENIHAQRIISDDDIIHQ